MPTTLPFRRRSRWYLNPRAVGYCALVTLALVALYISYRDQFGEMFSAFSTVKNLTALPELTATKLPAVIKPGTPQSGAPPAPNLPTVVRPDGNRSSSAATDAKLPTVIKLGPNATGSSTGQNLPEIVKLGPQQQSAPQGDVLLQRIQVIDGDTIDVNGQHYRLVGIDTPESGLRAKCQRERDLSARATRRLSEIVSRGVQFERVACGCPAGTEGTPACNYGRLCGKLTSGGRDVGQILIGEGLAKYYFCTAGHCPPKQPWCS